ncbi:class I SAM-dependent methyltransferase [Nocardiopsis flavescens]
MGAVRRVGLGRVETTLLWPLHHKVLDFRNREPVLGDVWAVDVLDHLEVDRRDVRGTSGDRYLTLLRAAWIDARVRAWVAAHPEGTVVHPGCGLDARALRVGVPGRGLWVDLDLPEVVALRRGLLPEPRGYRLVAGSVTDPAWWERVPAGAPVLVVAEGLFEYLGAAGVRGVLERVASRFTGGGEVVFDVVAPWVARAGRAAGWPMHGLGDVRLPERWCPGLELVEAYSVVGDFGSVPERPLRVLYRVLSVWPGGRDAMRVLRFRLRGRAGAGPGG